MPTPDTLSVDEAQLGGQANQQFRIDVIRPQAPLESLDPTDILATVFRTQPGGPAKLLPTQLTADLSAFAGQTVRLRIAVAAGEEVLAAGIDTVAISPRPPTTGGPGPGLAQNRFRIGKAKANRKKGTVTLSVQVPSAGVVSAKSASAGASTAGASKAKKPPMLIKPAQVRARAAGTVKLRLRPTPAALAILRQKGKLRTRIAVTFKAPGASLAKAAKSVLFKLAPRPAQRR